MMDRWGKVMVGIAASSVALSGVVGEGASAASAAPAPRLSAFAQWRPDADTSISLQATQRGPGQPDFFFVSSTSQHCDTATDEMVFESLFYQADVKHGALSGDLGLNKAVVAVRAYLHETEQRLTPCANPHGVPKTTDLGTRVADIHVEWRGRGPITSNPSPAEDRRDANACFTAVDKSTGLIVKIAKSVTGGLSRSTD